MPLKPCPFCGNKFPVLGTDSDFEFGDAEELDELHGLLEYTVYCQPHDGGCGALCGYRETQDETVTLWNSRPLVEKGSPSNLLLKPCPTCGKIELDIICAWELGTDLGIDPDRIAVICNFHEGGCGLAGGFASNEEDAILLWNTRS